jgi:TonB family protein
MVNSKGGLFLMGTLWNRRVIAALILSLLLVAVSQAKKKEDKEQLEQDKQLIESALDKVNIWGAGTLPFRLQAGIEVHPEGKGADDYRGTLVLSWFAPGEWRETITLPEFTQVRIASKGSLSTVRTGNRGGIRALTIVDMIDMRRYWTVFADESVIGARTRRVEGGEERCLEVKHHVLLSRELCVDPTSTLPAALPHAGDTGDSIEYGDYVGWRDKQIPRSIRSFETGRVAIELKVESVSSNGASADSQLSRPPEGILWESCDNPEPARILEAHHPDYPEAAKAARKEARVIVYLLVAIDGSVRNPQIVKSGGPGFDAATIRAVSRWKFQPAMCGTSPVLSEFTTTVNYSIGN